MKKVKFHELPKFTRLYDEVDRRFRADLTSQDIQTRLAARDCVLQFMKENGFNVDDDLEWCTWNSEKEYCFSVLRWL